MNLSKSQKEKKAMLQVNTISIMVLDQDAYKQVAPPKYAALLK